MQPYFALFKIAEKKEQSEDHIVNDNITFLIGKTYTEFKNIKNPEVSVGDTFGPSRGHADLL